MPITPIVVPAFPNVPFVLGVPALLRDILNLPANPPLGPFVDGPGVTSNQFGPTWGIYDADGGLAIDPDSVIAVEYRNDHRISDYPVEEGGFESYNKVTVPYDVRVTMTKGGTDSDRAAFLADCEALAATLDLFTVVTPEVSYADLNPTHFDLSRKRERGATLLTVEMWFEQVRNTATATYTSTKTASGASTLNNGTVIPTAPTANQAAAIIGGVQ